MMNILECYNDSMGTKYQYREKVLKGPVVSSFQCWVTDKAGGEDIYEFKRTALNIEKSLLEFVDECREIAKRQIEDAMLSPFRIYLDQGLIKVEI